MRFIRWEAHWVHVGNGVVDVLHDGCPRWPTGRENYSWPACYVGAVAQEEEEPDWLEMIESLEPGTYLIITSIVERSYAPDDPEVAHVWRKISPSDWTAGEGQT
jgi:hypothetical protein